MMKIQSISILSCTLLLSFFLFLTACDDSSGSGDTVSDGDVDGDVEADDSEVDGDEAEEDGDQEEIPADEDIIDGDDEEEVQDFCGNGICEPWENEENCLEDCQGPRRGSIDDLPENSVSCEVGCQRMLDCGHLGSDYSLIEDYDHCISLCNSADRLPIGGSNESDDYFRRCASVEDDCDALWYCGDWLKDPRLTKTCEGVCYCVSQYMSDGEPAQPHLDADLEKIAPALLKPALDIVVARNFSSIDIESAIYDSGVKATQESDGPYIQLRAAGLTTPDAMRRLHKQIELLPTFKDALGRVLAATELLIITPKTKSAAKITTDLKALKLSSVNKVSWSSKLWFATASSPVEALRLAHKLNQGEDFKAEINFIRYYEALYAPNDPYYSSQWHLHNQGENESVKYVDGRVWEAWELTTGKYKTEEFGNVPVEIGIFDDGCDLNQPDLKDKMQDAIEFPTDWEDQLSQMFGWHGTSVAGVAAAQGDNDLGVVGVCPDCTLRCSQALSSTSASGISDADMGERFKAFADRGSAVVNNSWGPAGGDPYIWDDHMQIPAMPTVISEAFAYCETQGRDGKGTLIVFAAGNSNQPISPNEYASYLTNVGVTAVDDQGLKSIYSTYGLHVDIAAPSNGGLNGITTTASRGMGDYPEDDNYTQSFGGTSSAAPYVTGVIALIIAANPELSAAEVREILYKSARKIDKVYGEYDDNGHSIYYGHGLVDAYVAVNMAKSPETCVDRESCLGATDTCTPEKDGICSRPACSECSDDSQCASGTCQALPHLGMMVCIEACSDVEGSECDEGFECINDYCVPSRDACGLCDDELTETCNGRDDDCDGTIDGSDVCQDKGIVQFCHSDADCKPLDDGTITHCSVRQCRPECNSTEDCAAYDEETECVEPSYRYGADGPPDHKICLQTSSITMEECGDWCGLFMSDESDEDIEKIVECVEAEEEVEDGEWDCVGLYLHCLDMIDL